MTRARGVSAGAATRLLLSLPGVVEGTSYGMPSFKLGKTFFARLRDGDTVLVVHTGSFEERDYLMSHAPGAFFTTDHYRNYPTVLVRLADVRADVLRDVVTDAWRRRGGKA